MIVVIQSAASKRAGAGHLCTADGKPVVFVAQPESAPPDSTGVFARPDDASENGKTWRDALLEYNNGLANKPARDPSCISAL